MITKAILSFAMAVSLCGCLLPIPTTLHVRGYVLDARTKKPVAGARVTIEDHPQATAMTKNDGSFDIPAETHWGFIVPPQEPVGLPDTVVVTKISYRPKTTRCSYEGCKIVLERE
jgi:hypothetical protein